MIMVFLSKEYALESDISRPAPLNAFLTGLYINKVTDEQSTDLIALNGSISGTMMPWIA